MSRVAVLLGFLAALAAPGAPRAQNAASNAAPNPAPNATSRGAAPAAAAGIAPNAPAAALAGANRIIAVVNGEVVTQSDVVGRTRLFALNAGIAVAPEVLNRLVPQVTRLLVDEKLRLQEASKRRIPVTDDDIAEAVLDLERRNSLPPGSLRQQLRGVGIPPRVLYDQIRTQIAWARTIRAQLGPQAQPTEEEIGEIMQSAKARAGQPEYLASEIFVPIDDPREEASTLTFVNQVIGQLRAGTPFPVAATQFSQAQTALQGGDLGWVRKEELDPEVASVLERMPPGAISNPIKVPGGFQIVSLRQRRETGREMATMLTVRQAFFNFQGALDPQNPTPQQQDAVLRAQRLAAGARDCAAVEAATRGQPGERPPDPGQVRLETVQPPPLRALLAGLSPGKASQPIITPEGVLVMMVCTRETRNLAELTVDQARTQVLRDRIENASRQLQRDLRRRGVIEMRS